MVSETRELKGKEGMQKEKRIVIASTTSTQNSGLFII
jgi:hypothetical protein